MTEICFLNSRRKRTWPEKLRAYYYAPPRAPGKRRMIDADMDFIQRACVARYEEPIFCHSHASTLFSNESLMHIVATANDNAQSINLDKNDDDDNDTGGVALPLNDHDHHYITNGINDISNAHILYETPPMNDIDSYRWPRLDTFVPLPPSRPFDHHAHLLSEMTDTEYSQNDRGEQPEWEGLEAGDLSRSDSPAALFHPFAENDMDSAHVASLSIGASRHSSTTHSVTTISHPFFPLHRTLEDADPALLRHLGMPLDDDALAVDDPQRYYDFADFMDSWRLRSLRDRHLPRFEPGLQPSVRLSHPHYVSRAQMDLDSVDIQGLHWKLIGPCRKQAISARGILHPSGHDLARGSSKQECTTEERQYRFRSFNPRHKAKFTHYQLRNVLAATSRNEILYSVGSRVQRTSYACPDVEETVMDLSKPANSAADFRISCLSASHRDASNDAVLLAGGFCGEYAVLNLNSSIPRSYEGSVTQAYNGLVTHIHNFADRQSGLLKAAFCSNDCSVSVLNVETLQFTRRFLYESSINCSATSPDGRLRVLVGDSREVLITDSERGHSLVTLQDQTDHSFACSWSSDGRYVAAAAQDGKTVVWDARNWSTPLRILHSSVSCARSLHFADDGALVVAENDDIVKIYDGGNFQTCQDICFFGAIAGVVLSDGGAEMTIANADKTVGGLLTFERSSQRCTSWSYGRMIAPAGGHRPAIEQRDSTMGTVDDVLV